MRVQEHCVAQEAKEGCAPPEGPSTALFSTIDNTVVPEDNKEAQMGAQSVRTSKVAACQVLRGNPGK